MDGILVQGETMNESIAEYPVISKIKMVLPSAMLIVALVGVCFFALLVYATVYGPAPDPAARIPMACLLLAFLFLAAKSIHDLALAPGRSLTFDAEGLWRTMTGKGDGLIRYADILRTGTDEFSGKLSLFGHDGKILLKVEHGRTHYKQLRQLITNAIAARQAAPGGDQSSHLYRPTLCARAYAMIFVLPTEMLFIWGGWTLMRKGITHDPAEFVMCATMSITAVMLLKWLLIVTTSRVEIDEEALTRSSLWNSTTFPLLDITRMDIVDTMGRGSRTYLRIFAGKRAILLDSLTFTYDNLYDMRGDILTYRLHQGKPLPVQING